MPDEYDELIRSVVKSTPVRRGRYDVDTALDLIAHHESGGRNIKQQVVPAVGGYNPSVGRVTGPSTASGPWQITNSTWRKRAPREIAQQYPTAMSAPVEVQRAVAGKIFRETGFQDWAPYNASLRRAIARGEQSQQRIAPDDDEYSKLIGEVLSSEQTTEAAPPSRQPSFRRGTTKGRATGRAELISPQSKINPADLLSAVSQAGGAVTEQVMDRKRPKITSRADIMRAEEQKPPPLTLADVRRREERVERSVRQQQAAGQEALRNAPTSATARLYDPRLNEQAEVARQIDAEIEAERVQAMLEANRPKINALKQKIRDMAGEGAGGRGVQGVQSALANTGVQVGNLIQAITAGRRGAGLTEEMRIAQLALAELEAEDPDKGWLAAAERALPNAAIELAKMSTLSRIPVAGRATLPTLGALSEADRGVGEAAEGAVMGELYHRGFGAMANLPKAAQFAVGTGVPAVIGIAEGEDPKKAILSNTAFGAMALMGPRGRVRGEGRETSDRITIQEATPVGTEPPRVESRTRGAAQPDRSAIRTVRTGAPVEAATGADGVVSPATRSRRSQEGVNREAQTETQPLPYIGRLKQGVVDGFANPLRRAEHTDESLIGGERWRYEPSNKTVYWTTENPSAESKFAVEDWLDRRKQEVVTHDRISNYDRPAIIRRINDAKVETQPNVETQLEGAKSATRLSEPGVVRQESPVPIRGAVDKTTEQPTQQVDGKSVEPTKPQWQHRDFGRVVESDNQSGVGRGRVRVIAEDGNEHVIQRANLRGQGNNLAVPVREAAQPEAVPPAADGGQKPPLTGPTKGGEKQPWEQTRRQFVSERVPTRLEGVVGKNYPGKQTARANMGEIHKQRVEAALGEGKPVPPEVLRDYPDLQPPKSGSGQKPLPDETAKGSYPFAILSATNPFEATVNYRNAAGKVVRQEVSAASEAELESTLREQYGLERDPKRQGIFESVTPVAPRPAAATSSKGGAAEAASSPVRSAVELKSAFEKHFRLAPAEADAVSRIADARAETWAKQSGKPKEEWYKTRIAEITSGGKPAEGALYQESQSPFYSQLSRVVDQKMPNRAAGDQVRAMLESPQSGVKAEEMKWTGLDDFLQGKRSVSKQEVQEFLKQNQVEVREVEKSEYKEPSPTDKNKSSRLRRQLVNRGFTTSTSTTRGGDFSVVRLDGSTVKSLPRDIRAIADELRALESRMYPERAPTKFEKFQLPGGENYRELLLTLPERAANVGEPVLKQNRSGMWAWFYGDVQDTGAFRTRQEAEAARGQMRRPTFHDKTNFRSSHFDEPNILAHVRFNDRVVDGKKVLFIEEVQSDWHQKGRSEGYKPQRPVRPRSEVIRDIDNVVNELRSRGARYAPSDADWAAHPDLKARMDALSIEADAASRQTKSDAVPDAPFKKTWHELAMKRMLRYAAENGYDRVAWTTGEQQAERYDLSKHVDAIVVTPRTNAATGERSRSVAISFKDGEVVTLGVNAESRIDNVNKSDFEQLQGKPLSDVVGKDISARIMEADRARLSGLDLKVGGEGMKGFYDQILPSFMNKYGKKWGARVETSKVGAGNSEQLSVILPNGEVLLTTGYDSQAHALAREHPGSKVVPAVVTDTLPVHSLDITPSMKKSVMEGQPLFQDKKASTEFLDDNRAIIRALQKPDVSSAAHEMAHVFRRDLEGGLLKTAEEWAGVQNSKWETVHEEKFARGFERYLREGKAPTEQLRQVFQQFKDWLTTIYAKIKGSPIEGKLSPEIRRVFGELLGAEAQSTRVPPVTLAVTPENKLPTANLIEPRKTGELSLPKSLEKAGLPGGNERFYDVKSNVASENAAKRIIKERGVDGARNWVQAGEQPSVEQSATAVELIKGLAKEAESAPADVKTAKLMQAGDLASSMAVRAKEAGQFNQYFATLAKESPEGAVYYAESRIKRQSPNARLSPEQRNGVFDTAVKLKATEAELESTRTKLADVERLLSESRTTRREPQVTKRLREWADQAEKDARARLASRTGVGKGGEAGASTIPSDIADYAIIGAAKIARGTADFAAWSSQMVDEFGEGIKPQLRRIRAEAERLVNEQSQLARKGKVVEEIARLETDPRVVESAKKFAAGMSRTEFHRYAREQYNLTPQQANDLAGRAYKTYTQANQNLRQAGKERRAEKEEPDASPERKAALIAQRDALMRQRGKERRELASMMRQIEEGRPKITARLNNQFRGIVVSALGTASRNVTTQVPRVVVEDMTKAFELAFVKGKAKLGWKLKEGDIDPRTRMLDTFKSSTYLLQRNKRVTEGILDEFPVEYENLFRRFSSDVDITPQTGVSKGIHKGLDKIDKGIEIINTPNRFQEFLVRRAVFRGELEAVLRAEGVDLNKMVAEGRQGEIDRTKIQKAVNTALRVTFADSPARGTMGDAFIKFTSSAPAPINPLTFSRFLYNGAKFTLEYQPTTALRGLYRTARGKPGAASDYAKAAVGTVMLTTAVQAYDAMHKDNSEWYLLNIPGVGEIDIRAYQPFASYIFAAHWARTKQSGKPISYEGTRAGNVGTYVEGLTGLSARPVPVYEVAKAAVSESQEWDGVLRQIKRVGGETVAGLLTPLKTPKQIIAQFDKEEAIVRDASQSPFTGPIRRNIPFASRSLPPLVRNEEVVTQPIPALQLAGVRAVMPDKRTEAEKLAQKLLRRDYTEVRTDEEITRGKQTADLRTRARRGETVDLSALPPRQRASIEKSAGMTRPEETFKRLGLEDLLLDVWPVATEQERRIIKPMLAEKADRVDNIEPFKAQLRAIGIVPAEELSRERQSEIRRARHTVSREKARERRLKPRQRPSLGYGYQ